MDSKRKSTVRMILFYVGVICVIALIITLCIPLYKLLMTDVGRTKVMEKIQSFGIFAPVIFVLLQILQVTVAFIPGEPMPIIAGALLGKWVGFFACILGFFLGTACVYGLVQLLGKPLVDKFVKKEHFHRFAFLENEHKLSWFTFFLFLIPGLPKDVLTYLISFQRKMKPIKLICLTTAGRAPATFLTIMLGEGIRKQQYGRIAVILVILAVGLGVGLLMKRYIDLHKKKKHKQENQK